MYRIRSASGTEAVYNSLEEFTAAVRRGEVAPEDEIFHSRANRWLDIKSHPHFRGAVNYSGPLTADSIFPSAAPPASAPTKPQPPARPAQGSGNQGAQAQVQVAEIPAPRASAPRTVYRPQLATGMPAPAAQSAPTVQPPAPKVAPPPVVKSSEIPFVDLGTATSTPRQHATVIPAQRSPMAPQTPPAQPATEEPDFLVMGTGMEQPVRASNGHKTVTGDADMLFDTPVAETLPPSQAATSIGPSGPAKQTASTAPAETPRAQAPVTTSTPPVAPPVERPSGPMVRRAEPVMENLDIPGPPLIDAPSFAMSPAVEPVSVSVSRGSVGLVLGSGAVAMLAAGVLIFWRPWSGPVVTAEPAPPQSHSAITGVENAVVAPPTEVAAPATLLPTPPTEAGLPPKGVDSSGVETGGTAVVTAAEPNFGTDMPAPAADLDLATSVPAAPVEAAVTPNDLALRLEANERQAEQDLASRLGNFRDLLASSRLGSKEDVTQTRSAWNAGADAIRQFRAQIVRLEQAYEDSVLASQRAQRWPGDKMRRWATHQNLTEPAETSQLADLMMNQVAEGLEILASLDGRYQIRNGAIRFDDLTSGTRFLSIRTWVEQRMQNWAGTPEAARPNTVNLILRALGEGFPPVE